MNIEDRKKEAKRPVVRQVYRGRWKKSLSKCKKSTLKEMDIDLSKTTTAYIFGKTRKDRQYIK